MVEGGFFVWDGCVGLDRVAGLGGGLEFEPEEGVGGKGEGVGIGGDGGEGDVAKHFDGDQAGEFGEVEGDGLGEAGEIGDAEDDLGAGGGEVADVGGGVFAGAGGGVVVADVGEDFAVVGVDELEGASAEDAEELAQGDHVAAPVEERGLVAELGFDVDSLVAEDGVHDNGEAEAGGVAGGETGVAIGAPLHGGADGVAVAKVDVVAHGDLVAVVEDGGAGEAEQEGVEELDTLTAVVEQGGEAAADAGVDAHAGVGGVGEVHVVALVGGDHLEGEFVVVAEEEAPLAGVGDGGGLRDDVGDGKTVFLSEGHVDARHEGEVEGHVALVTVAEVGADVGGPLVGFGEDEAVGVFGVDGGSDGFDDVVSLGKALAGGAVALDEVGDGIETEGVDAEIEPEAHGFEDFFEDGGVVEVEVRLVVEESVPVEGLGGVVPGPVGFFGVGEDDGGVFVDLVGGGPDVEVAFG